MGKPDRSKWTDVGRRIAGLSDQKFGEGKWNYELLSRLSGRSKSSVHRDLTGKGLTLYAALHYQALFGPMLPRIEYLEPRWTTKENGR